MNSVTVYTIKQGSPTSWLQSRGELECKGRASSLNHPPQPGPWKSCLPGNQSLVPKRLGTTAIKPTGILIESIDKFVENKHLYNIKYSNPCKQCISSLLGSSLFSLGYIL